MGDEKGCFGKGKSPYGCEEKIGNLWERSMSKWADYPYKPNDGRENLEEVTNSTWIVYSNQVIVEPHE